MIPSPHQEGNQNEPTLRYPRYNGRMHARMRAAAHHVRSSPKSVTNTSSSSSPPPTDRRLHRPTTVVSTNRPPSSSSSLSSSSSYSWRRRTTDDDGWRSFAVCNRRSFVPKFVRSLSEVCERTNTEGRRGDWRLTSCLPPLLHSPFTFTPFPKLHFIVL